MKKLFLPILFLSFLIILSGCRKQETAQQPEVTDTTGTETLQTSETKTFEDLISETKITDVTVKDQSSFVNTDKSYQEVTDVDVSNWIPYINSDYGFTFYRVADYGVFELTPGSYSVSGSEGLGEFFTIDIADKNNNTLHTGRALRTQRVTINGQDFTIEEFEENGFRTIKYYTEYGDYEYKMEFILPVGYDEYVDLFNKTMGTFRFF